MSQSGSRRPVDAAEQRRLEDRLELMSRAIRDKLDRVGIKLHLAEWQQMTIEERADLRDRPCVSAEEVERYRVDLVELVRKRCGREPDLLL